MTEQASDSARTGAYELLVATHVFRVMSKYDTRVASAAELVSDADLRTRDLAVLGLGSLDWMALATALEQATDRELPDRVLVDPQQRCIAGWAAALATAERIGTGGNS